MRQLKIHKSITRRETESINSYFAEVSQIPLLTEKEELDLFNKVASGSQDALSRVIKANLRFVISVAKQYQNQNIPLEDLISEGNFGLIKAAKRFDNTRGFKFISYAVWWIRQCIMQCIAEHSRAIRIPVNHINSLNKINKIGAQMEQELEREPTNSELSKVLEEMDIKIKDSMFITAKMTSLDAPVKDGEDLFLYDIIVNENSVSPDNSFVKESLVSDLEKVLKKLSNRERTIVCMYYGILGFNAMTLEEIGEYFDLTRERVRQIRDLAIRRLKNRVNSNVLKQHI